MSDAVADPFAEAFAQAEPPAPRPQAAAAADLPELTAEDIAAARSQTAQARAAAPAPAVNAMPAEPPGAPAMAQPPAVAPAPSGPQDEAFPGWREAFLAWHRRFPLARRLLPEQLSGVGLVRLAFRPPEMPGGVAMPLFKSERLVAGLSAKALPAFADAVGFAERPGPADWPVRELGPADAAHSGPVQWRYLITAAYPGLLKAPARALMGRAADGVWQVRGRRGLSRGRVGALAGGVVALLAAGALALWWLRPTAPASEAHAPAPAASAAASAAAAAHGASAAASGAPAKAEHAASEAGHAPDPAASAALAEAGEVAASAPAATEHAASAGASGPTDGHGKTDAPAPAAEAEEAPAPPRPQVVQPLPGAKTKRPLHALPETAASPVNKPAAAQPAAVRYALVSAPSADAAPLQAQRRRLRQALGREGEHLRLELMPAPGGQALTLWPIEDKRAAEALAQTLRQAGIVMRPVEF